MKNNILLITIFALILVSASIASAVVTEVNKVYYGTLDDNGNLITTQTPITNFNAIGFVCTAWYCDNVSGTLWNGAVQNSGASSSLTLSYPTTLQGTEYGIYFYKDGYFPYEVNTTYYGSGQAPNAVEYLTRKTNCQVPINHLIISHNGNNVTVNVTLDAGVSSPVQTAGPLNYVPLSIAYLYSVNATVDFRFIGPQNVNITKKVNLPASESREVYAFTSLDAGQYTIEVESNTNDTKCINSVPNKLSTNLLIENNRTNVTLPLIGIISPENKTYTNRTILVSLNAINATSVLYNWNGTNVSYNGPAYVNFNEGSNTLKAYAINNVTTAVASVTFSVNTTGNSSNNNQTGNIALNIISPQNITYNQSNILVNISTQNASLVRFSVDGISNQIYAGPVIINLVNGTYTLSVNASNSVSS